MSSSLDKLLGRLEDLDPTNLTILVQRLARERSLLETVLNTVREGVIVFGSDGIIEYANTAATELIGLKQSDIGTAILWKSVPDLVRHLKLSKRGRYNGPYAVSRELEIDYPEYRYTRLYIVPFVYKAESRNENENRYAAIISDITQEKIRTQEEIENAKVSSLFQLAAGVAHELGNPLNSLTIHLQLIKRQIDKLGALDDVEKIAKSTEICSREVSRLDGIISNFLKAVRPHKPDLQEIDLVAILEESLEVVGNELSDAKIKVDVAIGGKPPIVMADPNQIKQVYFNILKNAKDAMAGGGTLKMHTRSDDEFVYIAFGDTGEGIDEALISRVFQPYFTTKKKGHGLGMMIAQHIMNEHGGKIGVDSKKGVGTVVTLQFPKKERRIRRLQNVE